MDDYDDKAFSNDKEKNITREINVNDVLQYDGTLQNERVIYIKAKPYFLRVSHSVRAFLKDEKNKQDFIDILKEIYNDDADDEVFAYSVWLCGKTIGFSPLKDDYYRKTLIKYRGFVNRKFDN